MTPQQPDSEPSAPIRFTVTVQCKSCRVRIQVSSRKTRLEYKFTCPRCSTVNNIVLTTPIEPPPQSHVPPDVYQLAASPPLPVANRLPPIAYPLSLPKPIDLFAQALASNAPARTISNELPELQTIRTLARFGLMIAKSDGQVANAERIAVREFLATLFGHNAILARHIDPIMEAAEKAIPTEAVAIADVVRCMPSEKRYAVYVAAEKIADACGTRNQLEADTLRRVAIAFGMQPAALKIEPVQKFANIFNVPTRPNPEAIRRVAEAPPSQKVAPPKSLFAVGDPRKLLEIEPKVKLSVELIRRRFALLSEKINPKKAAAFGPEFVALADKHLAELRAAAESLIAPFGVPLVDLVAAPTPTDMRHNPDLDDVFG